MLGDLFRSFAAGKKGAKAIRVLAKTYSLEISHPQHLTMMQHISKRFELYNEHEMAVQFLAEFSQKIKSDHPQAKSEIEKYIRMSKRTYNRELAWVHAPQDELFRVARERFGIEPNDVQAA